MVVFAIRLPSDVLSHLTATESAYQLDTTFEVADPRMPRILIIETGKTPGSPNGAHVSKREVVEIGR
jgi:hypothetical protein